MDPYPAQNESGTKSQNHSINDQRRETRVQSPLHCTNGKVADITGSGMRILLGKGDMPEVGDLQSYEFDDGSEVLQVMGCVKWVRRGSAYSRQSEAGIEFVKLDQHAREALVRIGSGVQSRKGSGCVRIETIDLYALLGASHTATADQLTEAFDKACRWVGGSNAEHPNAKQKLDELEKAYAVLSDPEKRTRYDARRGQGQKAA